MNPAWILVVVIALLGLIGGIAMLVRHLMLSGSSSGPITNGKLWKYHKPPIRHICISLPYRDDKFRDVQKAFSKEGIPVEKFVAVVGKHLVPDDYDERMMSAGFRRHLNNNPKHLGHLGASHSHMSVWRKMIEEGCDEPVAIIEDDVIIEPGMRKVLEDRLAKLEDMEWDVLYGGMSCALDTYYKCKNNYDLPIHHDNICEVKHSIGLWYYVVNGRAAAEKMLKTTDNMQWMIDHNTSSEGLAKGTIKGFCSIPNFAHHPGTYSISAFDYTSSKSAMNYVSDTNS